MALGVGPGVVAARAGPDRVGSRAAVGTPLRRASAGGSGQGPAPHAEAPSGESSPLWRVAPRGDRGSRTTGTTSQDLEGRRSGDPCHFLLRIGFRSRGFRRNPPVCGAKFGLREPILSSSGGPASPAWPSARASTPPAGGQLGPRNRHERCDRGRTTGTSGATGAAGREGGKERWRFSCHSRHCPSRRSSGGPAPALGAPGTRSYDLLAAPTWNLPRPSGPPWRPSRALVAASAGRSSAGGPDRRRSPFTGE